MIDQTSFKIITAVVSVISGCCLTIDVHHRNQELASVIYRIAGNFDGEILTDTDFSNI